MTTELELKGIVKRFPGVLANDHIDLTIAGGEIRALVGENGAGKTTLMKILYGEYQPDEGEIVIRGQKQVFHSPADSIRAGLGMVYQQFMLFPSLTVTENIIYGAEPVRRLLIDRKAAARQVRELALQYGLEVDPEAKVGTLPVGVRQRVEILKTLYRSASILILDEPTAVLTPQERDNLFEILRRMADQGKTILFITHKLNEVMALADKATVLRQGRVTGELEIAKTNPEEICRYMVGRNVLLRLEKPPAQPGKEVLRVEKLSALDENGRAVLSEIDIKLHGGEIVGLAGVAGNGQSELVEAITGLRPVDSGRVCLEGREVTRLPISDRRQQIGFIPEDRVHVGLAVGAKVAENLLMGYQRRPGLSNRFGFLNRTGIIQHAIRLIDRFTIKVSSPSERTSNLSGGNLQKIVVARELSHDDPLIIADQPTRGVDVGSIEFIHQQLIEYRNQGKAILLVSADLSEIMGLSDRILVMYEGRLMGEVPGEQASEQTLGLMMAGAYSSGAAPSQAAGTTAAAQNSPGGAP